MFPPRLQFVFQIGAILIATGQLVISHAAESESSTDERTIVRLANDDFFDGSLLDVDRAGVLRFQGVSFSGPFEFPCKEVRSVRFANSLQPQEVKAELGIEMHGGNVFLGTMSSIDDGTLKLDTKTFGIVSIDLKHIQRIYRASEGLDLVYSGPKGLDGWTKKPSQDAWQDDGGSVRSQAVNSTILTDCGLPAKAVIEFELSWKRKPDFEFQIGVNLKKGVSQPFRFEIYGDTLVALREVEAGGDIAEIQEVAAGPGRVHLVAYVDQTDGRMLVYSSQGKPLAKLKLKSDHLEDQTGIGLVNKRGDICLERVHITRWSGDAPQEIQSGKSRIHAANGQIIYGELSGYDDSKKEMLINVDGAEQRVAYTDFRGAVFSATTEPPTSNLMWATVTGVRVIGDVLRVANQAVVVKAAGVSEELAIPIRELRSMLSLSTNPNPAQPNPAQPATDAPAISPNNESILIGTLVGERFSLRGKLVNGMQKEGASCLVWQPLESTAAGPLKPDVAGKIVYKETPPPPQAPKQRPVLVRQRGFLETFVQNLATSGPAPSSQPLLHLRGGDSIPCDIVKIDGQGITIKSPHTSATFVQNKQVKSVDMFRSGDLGFKEPAKLKRERLLTLPRMQRDNPPTHLLSSHSGDYLRGRLMEMDDQKARVEVRLESKELERQSIRSIYWLHADELSEGAAGNDPVGQKESQETRVLAFRGDGIRLAFNAKKVEGNTIAGVSDILGECQASMSDVNELWIGDEIDRSLAKQAASQWRLHHATEPIAAKASGGEGTGAPSGTESVLVGKPAPDFKLDLLDGKKYQLADHRGKIVVLDFWATWCGPCLRSMPQVERAVGSFDASEVELVAVNLQELPDQIKSMMERHKLQATVALDRDGVVAERYSVSGIPQTVVIGRDGNVARLFVGGNSKFEEQLRAAIEEVRGNRSAQPQ